jgi:hypothetical protein
VAALKAAVNTPPKPLKNMTPKRVTGQSKKLVKNQRQRVSAQKSKIKPDANPKAKEIAEDICKIVFAATVTPDFSKGVSASLT